MRNIISLLLLFIAIVLVDCNKKENKPYWLLLGQPKTFAGTWDCGKWGIMSITLDNTSVSGEYAYEHYEVGHQEGIIAGSVSEGGKTLNGTWEESSTPWSGGLLFTLAADGNSFTGQWWNGTTPPAGGPEDDWSTWNGTRVSGGSGANTGSGSSSSGGSGSLDEGTYSVDDPDSEIMFFSYYGDSSYLAFYGNLSTSNLTHVSYFTSTGVHYGTVIFDTNFIPIQWIMNGRTIEVFPNKQENRHTINPRFVTVIETIYGDTATEVKECTNNTNIYPESLPNIITIMEQSNRIDLTTVRTTLTTNSISTFDELIAKITASSGVTKMQYMMLAAEFSMYSSAIAFSQSAWVTTRSYSSMNAAQNLIQNALYSQEPSFDLFGFPIPNCLGSLACPFMPQPNPELPTVTTLLCRGTIDTNIPYVQDLCHFKFYYPKTNEYGAIMNPEICVNECGTSLNCFIDICMPFDLNREQAEFMQQYMDPAVLLGLP
jgi:hypothetical protein